MFQGSQIYLLSNYNSLNIEIHFDLRRSPMDIITENGTSKLLLDYPFTGRLSNVNAYLDHESLAKLIAEKGWKTMMVACCCDHLAEERWNDPAYMHKTNHILTSQAREQARRELTNKYFSDEQMSKLMEEYNLLDWEYNYKDVDPNERTFRRRIEDTLFEFQENQEMFEIITSHLNNCKYKMDDEGYAIENENEEFDLETDSDVIENQKKKVLERLLMPRVHTEHNRVYTGMPEPLSFWDYRSSWHQAFYVTIPEQQVTIADLGGCGSSGRRESNGRWSHAFASLAVSYGIETPTIFTKYDRHNVWREDFRLSTFATIGRDLSGNYQSTSAVMKPLFKGRTYIMDHNDKYEYSYTKRDDDLYY